VRNRLPRLCHLGNPAEVGRLVAYLCSEHARYISGSIVTIDGGLTSIPAG
jgi:NAD(P)-dependent dehydrogenase (short-subunit alcohol dehydrogenase family)